MKLERSPLGKLTTLISSGSTPLGGSKIYLSSGPVMLIRSQNVLIRSLNLEDVAFITEEISEKMKRTVVKTGDVLLNITGASIGRCAAFELKEIQANVNQHVCIIRAIPELLHHRYLMHFISQPSFQDYINSTQDGGTRQALTFEKISNFQIPLPPIAEQKRIAAILDKADELRGLRRRALEQLDAIAHSIFLEMFGELTSVTEKNKYSLLTGCIKCKLGEQITLQRGFDITKDQCREGVYPVISSGGISAYHAEYKASGPGVLLGRKGSVGRVHYVKEDYWPHDTTLWVKDFKGNNPIFVYNFFKRFPISDFEESTSNPTLNRNRLHPVNVFWPPVSLQQEFAQRIEAIEQLKATHRESLAQLNALFATLQHRAFRGEL